MAGIHTGYTNNFLERRIMKDDTTYFIIGTIVLILVMVGLMGLFLAGVLTIIK